MSISTLRPLFDKSSTIFFTSLLNGFRPNDRRQSMTLVKGRVPSPFTSNMLIALTTSSNLSSDTCPVITMMNAQSLSKCSSYNYNQPSARCGIRAWNTVELFKFEIFEHWYYLNQISLHLC